MEEYAKAGKWEVFDLTDEKIWGGMACGKSLTDVFGEEDHVKSITTYFEALLDDVAEFKKTYPKLPWTPQQSETAVISSA